MEFISTDRGVYDSELDVKLSKQGNKEAFGRLIEKHKSSMYRIAVSILNNKQDVEDALQSSVVKAYEGIIYLRRDEYFKTWLIRILINECKTILKKCERVVSIEDVNCDLGIVEDYTKFELTYAVNSLEKDLRIVTTLFYFEDLTLKEIAKLLDIPEGTVSSRLSRARNKLYEMLKER